MFRHIAIQLALHEWGEGEVFPRMGLFSVPSPAKVFGRYGHITSGRLFRSLCQFRCVSRSTCSPVYVGIEYMVDFYPFVIVAIVIAVYGFYSTVF